MIFITLVDALTLHCKGTFKSVREGMATVQAAGVDSQCRPRVEELAMVAVLVPIP